MKQVIILLLAVLTFALTQNASDSNIDFKSWKNKHKKDYKLKGKAYGVNETQAEKNFKANADRVRKHNSNKNVTYKQSLNENADLTDSDVTQRFTGLIPQAEDKNVKSSAYSVSSTNDVNLKALPVSLDYTRLKIIRKTKKFISRKLLFTVKCHQSKISLAADLAGLSQVSFHWYYKRLMI